MRKFRIIDYSFLPEYLVRQEKLTNKYYSEFKKRHKELVGCVNKHTLPIPEGGKCYVPATPKASRSGEEEIEQAKKELAMFCQALRPEMDEVLENHPDNGILSKANSVELAYVLMTQDSLPVTINYK